MFLKENGYLSLPHACGGVSPVPELEIARCSSSPRMWGCFQACPFRFFAVRVFPTHVGVFPGLPYPRTTPRSLPHACGGVSRRRRSRACSSRSSPRMWGCFLFIWMLSNGRWVFPTHVWVFPYRAASHPTQKGLPHACGARNKAPFLTVGGFSSFLFPAAHIGTMFRFLRRY